jgi:hypothetical protein
VLARILQREKHRQSLWKLPPIAFWRKKQRPLVFN